MKTTLFNDPKTIYVGYEDFFKEEFVKPFGESEYLEKFPLLSNTALKLEKVTLYQDPSGESGFHKFSFTIPFGEYTSYPHAVSDLYEFFRLHSESDLETPIAILPIHAIQDTVHIDILYGWSA